MANSERAIHIEATEAQSFWYIWAESRSMSTRRSPSTHGAKPDTRRNIFTRFARSRQSLSTYMYLTCGVTYIRQYEIPFVLDVRARIQSMDAMISEIISLSSLSHLQGLQRWRRYTQTTCVLLSQTMRKGVKCPRTVNNIDTSLSHEPWEGYQKGNFPSS